MKRLIGLLIFALSSQAAVLEVCNSGCTYSTVPAAFTAASMGDIIELREGQTFNQTDFLLLDKTCSMGTTTPLIFRSRGVGAISGRALPVTNAAHAAAMAIMTSDTGEFIEMANAVNIGCYRFEGIRFQMKVGNNPYGLINLGYVDFNGAFGTNEVAKLGKYIAFDRDSFETLTNNAGNLANCIIVSANQVSITNSYFSCYNTGASEAHCIAGWNFTGSVLMYNNEFRCSQISTLWGGSITTIPGVVPFFTYTYNNYYNRPWTWRLQGGAHAPTVGPPTITPCQNDPDGGGEWYNVNSGAHSGEYYHCEAGVWVNKGAGTAPQSETLDKNHWECKLCNGWQVEGNVMFGGWGYPNLGQQYGACGLLNLSDNADGKRAAHEDIANVHFQYNYCNKSGVGISQGTPYATDQYPHNNYFSNIVFDHLGVGNDESSPIPWIYQVDFHKSFELFDHNTGFLRSSAEGFTKLGQTVLLGGPATGFINFQNSILHIGTPQFGFADAWNSQGSNGDALYAGIGGSYNLYTAGRNYFINNGCTFGGFTCAEYNGVAGSGNLNTQPDIAAGYKACPGCAQVTDDAAMNFTNYAAGNYTLLSSSPGYRQAFEGVDVGADIAGVNNSISGVTAGAPTPYVFEKIQRIAPHATTADIWYSAYDAGTCVVAVSTSSTDFSSPVFTLTDSGGSTGRNVTATGLSNSTKYWARVRCNGQYDRVQSFFSIS